MQRGRSPYRWLGLLAGWLLIAGLIPTGIGAGEPAEQVILRSATPIVDPVFAADGRRLACVVGEAGRQQLLLLDLASNTTTTLVGGASDKRSPSFSPDGRRLYYCDNVDGKFDLMVVDLASRTAQPVLRTPEDEFRVVCAPWLVGSGETEPVARERLFFLRGRGGRGMLVSARPDGGPIETVLAGEYQDFVLGPDPGTILVLGERGIGETGFRTGPARPVAGAPHLRRLPLGDLRPVTWASGSRQLDLPTLAANGVDVLVRRGSETVIYDRWRGEIRALLPFGLARAAVAPDGRSIAVVERPDPLLDFLLRRWQLSDPVLGITNLDRVFVAGQQQRLANLSPAVRDRLARHSFVAVADPLPRFARLYAENHEAGIDHYITIDAIAFLVHLYLDAVRMHLIGSRFQDQLVRVAGRLADEAEATAARAASPAAIGVWIRLARFLALLEALAEPEPVAAERRLRQRSEAVHRPGLRDLPLIFAAAVATRSAVLDREVDFRGFAVPPEAAGNQRLAAGFRLLTLVAAMPLSIAPRVDRPDVGSAPLLPSLVVPTASPAQGGGAIRQDARVAGEPADSAGCVDDLPLILAFCDLASRTVLDQRRVGTVLGPLLQPYDFLGGEGEQAGILWALGVLERTPGLGANPDAVVEPARVAAAREALRTASAPGLLVGPVRQVSFVPERVGLSRLLWRRLARPAPGGPGVSSFGLLAILAAIGSSRAGQLEPAAAALVASLAAPVPGFPPAAGVATGGPAGPATGFAWPHPVRLSEDDWMQNLERGWLRALQELLEDAPASRDRPFLQSQAWRDRLHGTAVGALTTSWHRTLLHRRPAPDEGAPESPPAEAATEWAVVPAAGVRVDPYPAWFGRMRRLLLEFYARMVSQGYLPTGERLGTADESDELVGLTMKGLTVRMLSLLELLEGAAKKQRLGQPWSAEETGQMQQVAWWLRGLANAFAAPDARDPDAEVEETSLIVDLDATGTEVRHAAIGRVAGLWVRIDEGERGMRLYRGGIFTPYQLIASSPLTDLQWRQRLQDADPAPATWTRSYLIKADTEGATGVPEGSR